MQPARAQHRKARRGRAACGRCRLLVALACALAASACSRPAGEAPTLVLIVIDTIRQDHMSVYGYERPTTPELERLARESVVYTRAYSQAPWTTPSMASLLSSEYPSALGIKGVRSPLPSGVVLLPEILRAAGYRTAAVVSNRFCSARWGFARGFDVFDQSNIKSYDEVTANGVSDRALEILEASRGAPLFLLLHYFDPHVAYLEHEAFAFREPGPAYRGPIRSGMRQRDLMPIRGALGPADVAELARIYDSEIALTDHAIGRVLARLRAQGRFDEALIVVTADHGEELLDHGGVGHARSLFEELVRVPLLVKRPDGAAGVVDEPVALVDVYPTIAGVAGVALRAPVQGRPLPDPGATPPAGDGAGARPIFMETSRSAQLRGVVRGRYKLIYDLESGTRRLFDLAADPAEQRDRAALEPERAVALWRELSAWMARNRPRRGDELELSADEEERLRSLGYL